MASVSMNSALVRSSTNPSSLINGGNLSKGKLFNKNICIASSLTSKASQHKRKFQIDYTLFGLQNPGLNHYYKCIGWGSTYQECDRKYVVKGTSRSHSDFEHDDASYPKNILDFVKKFLDALYMFITPYGMVTHVLSIISAALLTVEKLSDISPLFFNGVLQIIVPSLLMGIYLAGLNQLADLEIDKINKPYLPLASGQLSITTGVIVIASCATMSLWISWIIGSWPLIWGNISLCLIWSAYSFNVPLLRWKKQPFLAAMSLFVTWAIILPIPSFLHMQTFVFKRPTIFPKSLGFVVAFMSLYSIGLALCKDIPDIEGDTKFGFYSFSARYGPKQIFWICLYLFETAFGVGLLAAATSPLLWVKIVTGLGHALLASVLWYQAKATNLTNKASIASFYMLVWKLLCAEYFLMPLIR